MGGKTALYFAEKCPDKIHKLVIGDIALRSYDHPHFIKFIDALSKINLEELTSRKDADTELAKSIPIIPIRQFLLKNLVRDDQNRFFWRINIPAIKDNLFNIMGSYQPANPFKGPLLFLRGEKSDYINDQDEQEIIRTFPQANIKLLPGASHWIHVDAASELIQSVLKFLSQ
jgi:pimeloyl-ACP methyl ester carboxylesterase